MTPPPRSPSSRAGEPPASWVGVVGGLGVQRGSLLRLALIRALAFSVFWGGSSPPRGGGQRGQRGGCGSVSHGGAMGFLFFSGRVP